MVVPCVSAAGRMSDLTPASTVSAQACGSDLCRVVMVSRDTAPIDGSASPRKPSVRMSSRSSPVSFEVACRSTARSRSARVMPSPSSVTRIRRRPPPSVSTSMRFAPASSAFSTSSLTTLAGRSTTSPAAMRLTTPSDSWRTGILFPSPRPAVLPSPLPARGEREAGGDSVLARVYPPRHGRREARPDALPAIPAAVVPGERERDPGPIRRSLSIAHGVWVPAFAGTTESINPGSIQPRLALAQVLDARAALFRLQPLALGRFRHFGLAPDRRLHRRLPDQVEQALARLGAVARLVAVLLRHDDDDAVLGQAVAGERHQANGDVIRQRRRASRVEAQLHRRRHLVDVLPAR